MKKVASTLKSRLLFNNQPVNTMTDLATMEVVKKEPDVVAESNIDGWVSKYIPDAPTDRFVLISPSGERFACKFYNPITKDFVGASLLSMYNLRDHFDRKIIPAKEGF